MTNTVKLAGLLVAALGLLLLTTQPSQLPSLVLVAPFAIIFLLFFVMIKAGFRKMGIAGGNNTGLAMLVAGLPAVLLAMQSLGQLTLRDAIMILLLFAIAYFYMYRRARSPS